MDCMEHDETLFTNHIILLLAFFETFLDPENCFWEQVPWSDKREIEFLDIIRFGAKKLCDFPTEELCARIEKIEVMMFFGCFSSRGT